ncbi:MAG: glycosyltransferase family 29 protein [Candidatus Poribacteria bacterium]|nr:glycosyltransferase family 29 protein [Candidatus Poribacteria bacterium]
MAVLENGDEFATVVAGKTVAVVGSAETTVGLGLGDEIDAHDLVVRFNNAFSRMPFPLELARDIGSRADILYCNHSILRHEFLRRPRPEGWRPLRLLREILPPSRRARRRAADTLRAMRLQTLVCSNNNLNYRANGDPSPDILRQYRTVIAEFEAYRSAHWIETPFRLLHDVPAELSRRLDGHPATTGLIGVYDLLRQPTARVSVYGMTFFHGGGHLFGTPIPLTVAPGTHHLPMEIDVMRSLIEEFGARLRVDGALERLLQG